MPRRLLGSARAARAAGRSSPLSECHALSILILIGTLVSLIQIQALMGRKVWVSLISAVCSRKSKRAALLFVCRIPLLPNVWISNPIYSFLVTFAWAGCRQVTPSLSVGPPRLGQARSWAPPLHVHCDRRAPDKRLFLSNPPCSLLPSSG